MPRFVRYVYADGQDEILNDAAYYVESINIRSDTKLNLGILTRSFMTVEYEYWTCLLKDRLLSIFLIFCYVIPCAYCFCTQKNCSYFLCGVNTILSLQETAILDQNTSVYTFFAETINFTFSLWSTNFPSNLVFFKYAIMDTHECYTAFMVLKSGNRTDTVVDKSGGGSARSLEIRPCAK